MITTHRRFTETLKPILTFLLCIGFSGCGSGEIEKGKDAIKHQLRDPSSAEFRNVFISVKADGVQAACGEVNSNNAFGGKTGFKRFVADGRVFAVLEKANDSEFNEVWSRFCR